MSLASRPLIATVTAATLLACGAGLSLSTAKAAPSACTPVGVRAGQPAFGCPVWLPSDERRVPVYSAPGSDVEVDHLYAGGRANWFWCKVSGPTSTDYGHRSSSWAKTLGDGNRTGWVPANYLDDSASVWTGLPDCGTAAPAPAKPAPTKPAPTKPGPGGPAPTTRPAPGPLDGPATARLLLERWGKQLGGDEEVRADLQAAAAGRTISNSDSCGNATTLDPRMLELLRRTTDEWTIQLSTIVTGHGCDTARHPKGKAYDVKKISRGGRTSNEIDGNAGNDPALNGEFAAWTAQRLPRDNKSGVGQLGCSGRATIDHPAGVVVFADTCNHQHVQIGESDLPLSGPA